eukprot:SAG31_NODE_65_length_28565_cov_8.402914_35_plen_194_part_00
MQVTTQRLKQKEAEARRAYEEALQWRTALVEQLQRKIAGSIDSLLCTPGTAAMAPPRLALGGAAARENPIAVSANGGVPGGRAAPPGPTPGRESSMWDGGGKWSPDVSLHLSSLASAATQHPTTSAEAVGDSRGSFGASATDSAELARQAAATTAVRRQAVRAVTFSFLCPLSEKYGTFIERRNALIEKVSTM